MKKLLIISSTKKSNFDLSIKIKDYLKSNDQVTCEVISLEDFELPLYTPTLRKNLKMESYFENISKIKELICSSNAMIWCSPEYNGEFLLSLLTLLPGLVEQQKIGKRVLIIKIP